MKVRIVVSYVPRYRRGHALDFVPPITGIHLAALTPAETGGRPAVGRSNRASAAWPSAKPAFWHAPAKVVTKPP